MFLNGEVKSLLLVFFGTGPAEPDTRMDTAKACLFKISFKLNRWANRQH
jgi:hypothetical protein